MVLPLDPRLAALVQRAAGLDARWPASDSYLPTDHGAGVWASQWAAAVGRGDAAAFGRRLAWDGLTADGLGWLTAPVEAAPRWALLLAAWVAEPVAGDGVAAVLAPARTIFAREVAAGAPAGWARLSGAARLDLEQALVKRLTVIGKPTWDATPDCVGEGWTGDALLTTLAALPVLGRLWGTVLGQAIDTAIEALNRLEADADLLQAFGAGYDLGSVAHIAPDRSDPHHGGRSVWCFETRMGTTLYYKPRSLALDAAWHRFVAWLNASGLTPTLRAPLTLNRGDYGWAEGVDVQPVADDAEARRFYRRMGVLVAIAHAFGATDLHAENVLAAGEHPLLVDLETLMPPRLERPDTQATFADAAALRDRLYNGIFDSLLVSWPVPDPQGHAVDLGALGDPLVGPDAPRDHLPVLAGEALRARDYGPEVVAGFDAAYEFLLAHREALLSPDGPLAAFDRAPVRMLFRQTRHYAKLLEASFAPARLADGRTRAFGLDLLVRTFLRQAERPALWPVIAAERRALDRLDVPYMGGTTDSRDLMADDTRLIDAQPASPLQATRWRIQALSAADQALQRAGLVIAVGRGRADWPVLPDPPQADRPFDPLADAQAIAEGLARRALFTADGAANWLARVPTGLTHHARADVIGVGLWDGALGTALFLAGVAEATGDAAKRDLARAALIPIRLAATTLGAVDVETAAGLAYGLTHLAPLLADDTLIADVRNLVERFDAAALATIETPDVIGGLAGVLLALLGVHTATGSDAALARAVLAGEGLLTMRAVGPGGARGWAGQLKSFPAGFGHGQAGIAAALLKLVARTGDERFAAAADESYAIEATRFVAASGDWRVAIENEEPEAAPRFMAGWCHGAPGMLLGRLASRGRSPARDAELTLALTATLALEPSFYDFACCGASGRVEILLEAAAALNRPDLAVQARRVAAAMPSLAPLEALEDVDPRYLKGMASVGWALLRVADPGRPCLLAGA